LIVVALTCVFVEPTSGIIVGILLSLGKGAFLESRAWVLCRLRQGDEVIAQFNCDLVRRLYSSAAPKTVVWGNSESLQCLWEDLQRMRPVLPMIRRIFSAVFFLYFSS
jgi:hypothetical protein